MQALISTACLVGYDDVGRGRPVVLLHAFPLSRAMWQPQVDALRTDHRVIVPDLRGFGGTEGFNDTPSIAQMADDVAALLDTLRVREPIVLGGLSMGGYVALAFAHQHAARLRGLVLADTRAEPDSAEAKANRDKLIAFAQNHTARDVIGQMLPRMVAEETRIRRPEVIDTVLRIASGQAITAIIGALRAMRDRADAGPWLGRIRVPTLVIAGAEDVLTPPSTARQLQASISTAQLAVIEGAGHLSNLEQSARFNDALRSFLQALPDSPKAS